MMSDAGGVPKPAEYMPIASSTLKSSMLGSDLLDRNLPAVASVRELCFVRVLLRSVLVVAESTKLEVLVQAERTLALASVRSRSSGRLGGTLLEI